MLPHDNLRRLREARGWTQAEAAAAAGATLAHYLAWETGRAEISLIGLALLADAFGMDVGDLAAELIEGWKPKK